MSNVPPPAAALRASAVDLAYITSLLIEASRMAQEHACYRFDAAADVQSMMTRAIEDNMSNAISAAEQALRAFREAAEAFDEHYEDEAVTGEAHA
jgi:hypothetical protein